MSDYYLIPKSTMEGAIDLLENLDSPYPTDFFVCHKILCDLKYALHKIDIDVKVTETVYIDNAFRCAGSSQYPLPVSQPDNLPISASLFNA